MPLSGLCSLAMGSRLARSSFAGLAALLLSLGSPRAQRASFDREGVLGTSFHLGCEARDASRIEAVVLSEIRRLSAILSAHDPSSELSSLPIGKAVPASADLRAVLAAAERWRLLSHGAFDAAVGAYVEVWRRSEAAQQVPTAADLGAARELLAGPRWLVDPEAGTVTRRTQAPLILDGLAKGYVIDRAVAAARRENARGIVLDIGGDLFVEGEAVVAIADPARPSENADPLCSVKVRDEAIATSGGYSRGFEIGGRHYSHLIDPRTGMPARSLQATAIAKDAMTADALATALSILDPEEGLAMLREVPGADALIVDGNGKVFESPGFASRLVEFPSSGSDRASAWPAGAALRIEFELAAPRSFGGRGGWRRPYVSAWVEDEVGAPVRVLCLWMERAKWFRDLRRFSRQFDLDDPNVYLVTRATRPSGTYSLTWDGTDDSGIRVRPGKYTVFVEAVREHGTHQILEKTVVIDGKPFVEEVPGGTEIARARLTFEVEGKSR
ncbi:MAG: hypothetical protein Fur0037_17060 [Planctomycetota bacterium]